MKISTCVVALLFTGCIATPDDGLSPDPGCTNASCLPSTCSLGVCEPGCPENCSTPAPVCPASIALTTALPVDVSGTTVGAAVQVDHATCGGDATGPEVTYEFHAPLAGRYEIAATGSFAIVLSAQHNNCDGPEAACSATTALTVSLEAGQSLAINIAGVLGAAGTYELHIDKLADACGDNVCEAGESTDSCPADCGAAPVCGNTVCEAGENSTTCPADCGIVVTSGPACGDGVCSAGEDSNSCPADCGTSASGGGDNGGSASDGGGDGSASDGDGDGSADDGSGDDGSGDGSADDGSGDGSDDGSADDGGGDDGGGDDSDGGDDGDDTPHLKHGHHVHKVTRPAATQVKAE